MRVEKMFNARLTEAQMNSFASLPDVAMNGGNGYLTIVGIDTSKMPGTLQKLIRTAQGKGCSTLHVTLGEDA